jgi:hypothetical protein
MEPLPRDEESPARELLTSLVATVLRPWPVGVLPVGGVSEDGRALETARSKRQNDCYRDLPIRL